MALAAVIVVNLMGIHVLGNVRGWDGWLRAHRGYFFVWRACLYIATMVGWCWMRTRVKNREPDPRLYAALRRAEVAALLVVLGLEVTVWLTPP